MRDLVHALRRSARDRDVWRELAPLALPLALAPWLLQSLTFFSRSHVFRDTNMFNYAAWCMLHGQRIYDRVATPDGPLVYILHAALQILAPGGDDSAYRRLDLAFETVAAVIITLLVTPRAPRFVWLRRVTWTIVGASLWLAEVVQFDFTASTQRESFYVTLGMLGLVLVFASSDRSWRVARWMLLGGAYVAGWLMFGKQTQLTWSGLVVLAVLLLPAHAEQTLRSRLKWVLAGIGLAVASALAFVAIFGSLRGYWFWSFRYNFLYYRFHEPVAPHDMLTEEWIRDYLLASAFVLAGGLAAVMSGALPARGAVLAITPMVNVGAALVQMHGWRYHFVPAAFSAMFFFVYALAAAWGAAARDDDRRDQRSMAALALTLFIAWPTIERMVRSPWLREVEEHRQDPLVNDPHEAGRVLASFTQPDDRVFYFGDDPATVFDAKRLPATPYIVAWMFDLHHGGRDGPTGPSAEVLAARDEMQTQLFADACSRLLEAPPAVVVRDDSAGFKGKGIDHVLGDCPTFKPLLGARYHVVDVGSVHLYLRDDRTTLR